MNIQLKTKVDAESVIHSIIKELTLNYIFRDTGYEFDDTKYSLEDVELKRFYHSRHCRELKKTDIDAIIYCNAVKADKIKLLNLAFNITIAIEPGENAFQITLFPSSRKQRIDYGLAVFPVNLGMRVDVVKKHFNYFKLALV